MAVQFTNTPNLTSNFNYTYNASPVINTSSGWQQVTLYFPYCAAVSSQYMNIEPLYTAALIDDVSLVLDPGPFQQLTVQLPSNSTICKGDSITLKPIVMGAYCNVAYTWNPGGSHADSIRVSPSSTTVYTFTVTDGCNTPVIVSDTINVSSKCCTGNTIVHGGNYNSSSPFTSINTIAIHGTINITGNVTFNCPDMRISPGDTINITTGNTLTITNASYLHACTDMWAGIFIQPGATLIINNDSRVEDAIEAIKSFGGGNFQVNTVLLNKNLINISIQPYASLHPGAVVNTVFTCRNNIPPGTPVSAIFPAFLDTHPVATLASPNTNARTNIGVYALGNFGVTVGSASSANLRNTFDNMNYGVYSIATNLTVYNNLFRKLNNTIAILSNGYRGVAVFATNSANFSTSNPSTWMSIIVGGSSANQDNEMFDCWRGVDVTDYVSFDILNNNIHSANTKPNFPDHFRIGDCAIFTRLRHNTHYEVRNNTITNYSTGIHLIRTGNTGLAIFNDMNINGNLINNTNQGYTNTGIFAEDVVQPFMIMGHKLRIEINNVNNAGRCIWTRNITEDRLAINANPNLNIRHSPPPVAGNPNAGIRVESCLAALVTNNPLIISGSTNKNIKGIYVSNSPDDTVTCNQIFTVGQGMVFENSCFSSYIRNNSITTARDGFVLLNNGVIGIQGAAGSPADNAWAGTFSNSYTLTDNTLHPNLGSKMYVRTNILPIVYHPAGSSENKTILPGVYPQDTYDFIGPPKAMVDTIGPLMTCPPPPPPNCCEKAVQIAIVHNQIPFAVFIPQTQWIAKSNVFESINNNPLIMAGDTALQNFNTANSTTAIGALYSANSSMMNGSYASAVALNSSFIPANQIENNHQTFNQIFLATLANGIDTLTQQQFNDLMSIAVQCPISGGRAVHQARAMLNGILKTNMEFSDSCFDNDHRIMDGLKDVNPQTNIRVSLFPNPNNGNMVLEYDLAGAKEAKFTLLDLNGKIIREYMLDGRKNSTAISEETISNGVYLYQITLGNGAEKHGKIVIVK